MLYGALPHESVQAACAVLRRHALPYVAWPQLPQRHFFERSIVQASWGLPGLVLDESQRRVYVNREQTLAALPQYTIAFMQKTRMQSAEWSQREAAGLRELMTDIDTLAPDVGIKGQLLGPISLAAQLTDEHQQPLLADPALFEGVVIHCCVRARLQADSMMCANRPAMVCLEEPFYDVMHSPFMTIERDELLVALARVVLAIPCQRALTLRCGTPLGEIVQLPIDVLIVTHWEDDLADDQVIADLVRALSNGMRVGIGVVPVGALNVAEIAYIDARVYAIIQRFLLAGATPEALRSGLVIAPSQSLGQAPVDQAEAVIALTCTTAAAVDALLVQLIGGYTE
jgi:hypothetical protein